MQLFDICANLTDDAFAKDREAVLERAYKQGVGYIFVPGSNLQDSVAATQLAITYNNGNPDQPLLYNGVGYHPHNAKEWTDDSQEQLAELAHNYPQAVKAIGECGLDYNRNFSTPEEQRHAFIQQLELAISLELPVFLHERDAHADFLTILKEHQQGLRKMLVHCFTGSRTELQAYLELGCYIGITGWFCDERRGSHLHELVGMIPSDKLLIETDAPYLLARDLPTELLNQNNKRRNEPAFLPHLANSLANHLAQDATTLAKNTTSNTIKYLSI